LPSRLPTPPGCGLARERLTWAAGLAVSRASLSPGLVPRNVAAIDPAAQFTEACRARNPRAEVRVGAAEELPWPDERVDAALRTQRIRR
jgi:hypothetical protein